MVEGRCCFHHQALAGVELHIASSYLSLFGAVKVNQEKETLDGWMEFLSTSLLICDLSPNFASYIYGVIPAFLLC